MTATLDDPLSPLRNAASRYHSVVSQADKDRCLIEYLHRLIEFLLKGGQQTASPLLDALGSATTSPTPATKGDRRSSCSRASSELLGRICAVIDLLVGHGMPENIAAQTVVQQMALAGVQLPEFESDKQGWQGLLKWRMALFTTNRPLDAWSEYKTFARTFSELAAPRAETALKRRVWDRRTRRQKLS